MKFFERMGGIALLAGVGCYFFAFLLIVLAPAWLTDAEEPMVIDVNTGERVHVPEYTAAQAAGQDVYRTQVCWHCHSQFVRPVNDEDLRWGPVSQAGESMVDRPHLFGTRRIGPDLAREGLLRVDDWHRAHFFDARYTVPQSVMPAFPWLFRPYPAAEAIRRVLTDCDTDGDGVASPKLDKHALWPPDHVDFMKGASIDNGGVMAPSVAQGVRLDELANYEDRFSEKDVGDGVLSDYDARPRGTQALEDLVAYMQRLGTAIGPWRRPLVSEPPMRPTLPPMVGLPEIQFGNYHIFDEQGNPSLDEAGQPQFETASTDALPDGLMPLRNRNARLYGLAWEKASLQQREDARFLQEAYEVQMAAWRKANPTWDRRLVRGADLYARHCVGCHGDLGRGNGDAAQFLLARPRDFTVAQYRYRSTPVGNRPLDGDLFRSIERGLPGSAMPSFRELSADHIWLLVDYVKHFAEVSGGIGTEPVERGRPFNDESNRVALPPLPPLLDEQREELFLRGKVVFSALKCSNCHGTTGRGDGPGWATERSIGGSVRARDFAKRHDLDQPELRMRGGATPRDIYRAIMTGLDGTGMPAAQVDFALARTSAEKVATLRANGAPAEEIAAAEAAERVQLFSQVDASLPGVVVEDGRYYLDRLVPTVIRGTRGTFGDDWAVVWYVYRLMYGEDAVWPVEASEGG